MIADILILSAGFASGWFLHQYRERLLRIKTKVKDAVEAEFKK